MKSPSKNRMMTAVLQRREHHGRAETREADEVEVRTAKALPNGKDIKAFVALILQSGLEEIVY